MGGDKGMKKQEETIVWQKNALSSTGDKEKRKGVCALEQLVFYGLLFASAMCMAEDLYSGIIPSWMAFLPLGMLLLISVALNAAFSGRQYRKVRFLGNTALLLLAAIQAYLFYQKNKDGLKAGMASIAENYLKMWNYYYGTGFLVSGGDTSEVKTAAGFVLFLVLAFLLFLTGSIGRKRIFTVLPAAVLISGLLVGYAPGYLGLSLFLSGLLFDAAVIKQPGQEAKKAVFILAAVVVFTGGFVLFQKPAEHLIRMEKPLNAFQRELEQELKMVGSSLISWNTQDGTVDNHTPKYRKKEVMKVHLNRSYGGARLYLRGYYGSIYENGVWKNEEAAFAKACAEHGISEADGAYDLAQLPHLYQSDVRMGNTKVTCQISYTGIQDTYTYLPYGMNFSKLDEALLWSGDYNLKKSKKRETISAEGTILCLTPDECPTSSIETILGSYDMMLTGNTGGIWREEEEFFSWYNKYVMEHNMTVPKEEKAVKALAEEIREEKEAFEERDDYTSYYDSDDTASVNAERAKYVRYVQNTLSDLGTYSLELDSARGEDPVQYFLETSHRGYCVHFASAGVFLLRELGVPARFVTGYVTQPDGTEADTNDILTNTDYTVLDSSAHAWAEVYYDDYGWVPAEMTPGYQSGVSKYPTEWTKEEAQRYQQTGQNPVQPDTESEQSAQNGETQTTDTSAIDTMEELKKQEALGEESKMMEQKKKAENAKTKAQNKVEAFLSEKTKSGTGRVVSGLLGVLLVAFAVLFGRFLFAAEKNARTLRFAKRLDKWMKHAQYEKAVQQMNRRLYELLKKKCRLKTEPDDAGYLCLLQEQFAEVSKEEWKQYMDIARKAAFANGKVTREDVEICLCIYKKVVCRNSK